MQTFVSRRECGRSPAASVQSRPPHPQILVLHPTRPDLPQALHGQRSRAQSLVSRKLPSPSRALMISNLMPRREAERGAQVTRRLHYRPRRRPGVAGLEEAPRSLHTPSIAKAAAGAAWRSAMGLEKVSAGADCAKAASPPDESAFIGDDRRPRGVDAVLLSSGSGGSTGGVLLVGPMRDPRTVGVGRGTIR